jgi:hypothetical protein
MPPFMLSHLSSTSHIPHFLCPLPAIIAAHSSIVGWTWGGDAMDHDTIALMKLKEEMRLRQRRHAAGPRAANEAMKPQIKMIVSNWYTDELGNQSRFIKAHN